MVAISHQDYDLVQWFINKYEIHTLLLRFLSEDLTTIFYDFGRESILSNICDIPIGADTELFFYLLSQPIVREKMHLHNNYALEVALSRKNPFIVDTLLSFPNVQTTMTEAQKIMVSELHTHRSQQNGIPS